MLPVIFGFSSALVWGAADFFGGIASRRSKAYLAVLYGEAAGLVVLLIAGVLSHEQPIRLRDWLLCTAAGGIGVLGLLIFFQAMVRGAMSLAAPVSAVMAAALPVIVGIFIQGSPGWLAFLGFLLALVAIWFISQADGAPAGFRLRLADVSLPLLAGVGFGIYLILMNRGSQDGFFWPMLSSRTGGVIVMILYTFITRQSFLLPRKAILPVILNGLLDISGNALYVLAGHFGRMDVAAVLASLYPGSTVLLANTFLHEHISRRQWLGIAAALAAIILLTI